MLTPLLLKRFAHLDVEWAPPEDAEIVAVGSVLDIIPPFYSGLVVGTGKLHPEHRVELPDATILSLRGPLTARNLKVPSFGDIGLLANELVSVQKHYQLGIVPHWSDTELVKREDLLRWKPHIIDPTAQPLHVIREIGRCRKIVSSSLHGIIVADAFGIPRRVEVAPRLAQWEGGLFKFDDYNASVGHSYKVGKTSKPTWWRVQDVQSIIFDVLEEVGARLG